MKTHPILSVFAMLVAMCCPTMADLDKTLAKLDFQDLPAGPLEEMELPFKDSKIGEVTCTVYVPESGNPAQIVEVQRPDGITDKALRLVWGPSIGHPELPAFSQIRLDFSDLTGSLEPQKPLTFEIVLRSLTETPGIFISFSTGIAGQAETYSGRGLVSADCTPRDGAPAFQWKLGFPDKRTGENIYTPVSPFTEEIWTTVRVTFAKRADGDGFDVTLSTASDEIEIDATERVTLREADRQGEVPDEPSYLVQAYISIGDHDPNRAEIPIEILSMRLVQ